MSDQANPIDDLRQRLAGVAQSPAYVRLSREVKEAVAKRIAWARKHARRGLSHRPHFDSERTLSISPMAHNRGLRPPAHRGRLQVSEGRITWEPLNIHEIPGKAGSVRAWLKAHVIYPEVARPEIKHWNWSVQRIGFHASGEAATLDAAKAACEAAAGPYLRLEALLPHLALMAEMAALMPGCKAHLGIVAVGEGGPKRLLGLMDFGEFAADLLHLLGYASLKEILT